MAPAEKSLNFGASARRLIGLLKPHRLRVIAVLALSVTAVVMNVVAPKVLGKAVDAVFAGSVSMHLPLGSTKAQAVAALAYGTATVPAVHKITGPGNAYVASAKRRVFGQVGIDMIAGPSEIVVVMCRGMPPPYAGPGRRKGPVRGRDPSGGAGVIRLRRGTSRGCRPRWRPSPR